MKSISNIFHGQGSLIDQIQGFQYRPEQEAMAKSIMSAIQKGNDLICEAGTGTGKTIAYLVPILLSGKKVIISTGTRHLQDQLKQKDLPRILDVLDIPVKLTVLKGRTNYFCFQRAETAHHDPKILNFQQMAELQEVMSWSVSTKTGDINELDMIAETSTLRHLITSTTENCLRQSCLKFDDCFVFKNRKAAMESDIIITNHHLLLSDMALRDSGFGEVLPLADVIIFDEAHQLTELASIYFSQRISSRQLLALITDIRIADREEAGDIQKLDIALIKFERAIRDLRLVFGQKDRRANWQNVWEETTLSKDIFKLIEKFQYLLKILEAVSERGKLLEHCFQRSKKMYHYIDSYIETHSEEMIRWIEIKGHYFYLNQTPICVAETFQSQLGNYNTSNIFISASLAVGNDFSHFTHQLGLIGCASQSWESPFDYKSQTRLYIPLDLPDPNHLDFFDAFIERTIKLLDHSQGRAFVLFTSHRILNKAANILGDGLNYPLFIQGNAPRSEILNQFRKTKNAVLLGTNSFWEGIDVKGEALSLVIIDKLPFASPDDPVLQARLTYLSQQGGNPFMDYQVPRAAITLKQGVGRLIRDTEDRGICVICDKRIINKPYGKKLLEALPAMPVTHDILDVKRFYLDLICLDNKKIIKK